MVSNILVEHCDLQDFAGAGFRTTAATAACRTTTSIAITGFMTRARAWAAAQWRDRTARKTSPARHGRDLFTAERGTRVYGNTIWNIFSNGGGDHLQDPRGAARVRRAAWNN